MSVHNLYLFAVGVHFGTHYLLKMQMVTKRLFATEIKALFALKLSTS